MSKNTFEEALSALEDISIDFDNNGYVPTAISHRDVDLHFIEIYKGESEKIKKALMLGKLYKEFFEALNPFVDSDSADDGDVSYTFEYLDFKSEDTIKCLEIFKKIKELENENN